VISLFCPWTDSVSSSLVVSASLFLASPYNGISNNYTIVGKFMNLKTSPNIVKHFIYLDNAPQDQEGVNLIPSYAQLFKNDFNIFCNDSNLSSESFKVVEYSYLSNAFRTYWHTGLELSAFSKNSCCECT